MIEHDKIRLDFRDNHIVHCIQCVKMHIVQQIALTVLCKSLVFMQQRTCPTSDFVGWFLDFIFRIIVGYDPEGSPIYDRKVRKLHEF